MRLGKIDVVCGILKTHLPKASGLNGLHSISIMGYNDDPSMLFHNEVIHDMNSP